MKWLKNLQRIYSEFTVIILKEICSFKYNTCKLGRECTKETVLFQCKRFSSNFTLFQFYLK